ncbi:uncharacterized protein BXZ73DRAFT_37534 [Epithele typhae]|uniref:uncharacterized protein n=1 Tax=Epithele typhae TaxID=378194 RepID=UPI002007624B|nr:uncharacterized protein BXZ73DRAFT_37534 [Epithele typhae]KAH9946037.1 hypothetical protein BXZ73DRAFT_37534 [Epithele typhae]
MVFSDDDDEGAAAKTERRLVKRASSPVLVASDEEEDPRPRKRGKLTKERPQSPEDLMDEVDEKRIITSRFRKRDKRSTFQKTLEKLKRKKRGEATESSASEEEEEDQYDDAPFPHAHPDANGDEDEDEDEGESSRGDEFNDSFIVEDDTSQLVELPPEFSMGSYQDLLHHFKIVCQMFVHIAVHEEEEREQIALELQRQQYFSVPLKITRRKLEGMRDSIVAGSTWKPWFRKALNRYPDYEEQFLDFTVPGCDACHLGSRKSTKQGRLSGLPYESLTYQSFPEEVTDSSEEEGSEESSKKKEFVFGRFCAKRTRTYHRFTHWEYHLFHALREEVDSLKASQADRSFVKVAYAKGKQPPRDLKDADAIMDWLDERQVINFQWQELKTMMNDAHNLEVRGKKGDDSD